jgi:hypothetical protein
MLVSSLKCFVAFSRCLRKMLSSNTKTDITASPIMLSDLAVTCIFLFECIYLIQLLEPSKKNQHWNIISARKTRTNHNLITTSLKEIVLWGTYWKSFDFFTSIPYCSYEKILIPLWLRITIVNLNLLRGFSGFSPQANYTERATRIEGVAWWAQRIPTAVTFPFK